MNVHYTADPENKTWLGQSWFGINWRKLMDYNSMFSAFFLNGGLLGMIFLLYTQAPHPLCDLA